MRLTVEGVAEGDVEGGITLLEACERIGVAIVAACGGFACCNTCRVVVLEGAEHLSERLPEEEPFLDADHQRLACQAHVRGPVSVRLAPGA